MTAGKIAKAYGLKLNQVAEITGQSLETLSNWAKKGVELYNCIILGCIQFQNGHKLEFDGRGAAELCKFHGFASLNQICEITGQKRDKIRDWLTEKPDLFHTIMLGALAIKTGERG